MNEFESKSALEECIGKMFRMDITPRDFKGFGNNKIYKYGIVIGYYGQRGTLTIINNLLLPYPLKVVWCENGRSDVISLENIEFV